MLLRIHSFAMPPLILGFGKTGQSLKIDNAIIYDDKTPCDIPWDAITYVIQSAGIPPHHPIALESKRRQLTVKTDLDIFWETFYPKCVIAVTGTNGKSTVTAMIYHILKHCGYHAEMGGNIGVPVLNLQKDADIYVLELSSFQLALSTSHCYEIGVWTNTSIDHLDWHQSFEAYVQAKARLCAKTIITRDSIAQSHYQETFFTFFEDENASLAYSVGVKLGLPPKKLQDALHSFKNLPHRQEHILTKDLVTFINDSKATNVHATQHAFETFKKKPIFWISGGRSKDDDLNHLDLSCVQKAYYIGESKERLYAHFPGVICETLQQAVEKASLDALSYGKECIVLLSPACSSLDQFQNFEQRGERFKEYVLKFAESV